MGRSSPVVAPATARNPTWLGGDASDSVTLMLPRRTGVTLAFTLLRGCASCEPQVQAVPEAAIRRELMAAPSPTPARTQAPAAIDRDHDGPVAARWCARRRRACAVAGRNLTRA